MTRRTRAHILIGSPVGFSDDGWQVRGKWCKCLLVLGCPHGHCPACDRRTIEHQHLDGTQAGSECDKLPLPLSSEDREYIERRRDPLNSPPPPRPRSTMWCTLSETGQACDTQPADGDLFSMWEHARNDHHVEFGDTDEIRRVVYLFDREHPRRVAVLKHKEPWPRQLDLLPTLVLWTLRHQPLIGVLRVPPELSDVIEKDNPGLILHSRVDV